MKTLLTILIALTIGANAGYNKIKCDGAVDSIVRNNAMAKDNLMLGNNYMAKHHIGLTLKATTRFKSYCGDSENAVETYTDVRAEVEQQLKIINGLN